MRFSCVFPQCCMESQNGLYLHADLLKPTQKTDYFLHILAFVIVSDGGTIYVTMKNPFVCYSILLSDRRFFRLSLFTLLSIHFAHLLLSLNMLMRPVKNGKKNNNYEKNSPEKKYSAASDKYRKHTGIIIYKHCIIRRNNVELNKWQLSNNKSQQRL